MTPWPSTTDALLFHGIIGAFCWLAVVLLAAVHVADRDRKE